MTENVKLKSYQDILQSYSQKELDTISQVKRILEVFVYDSNFVSAQAENKDHPYVKERFKKIGIDFNLMDIVPMLDESKAILIARINNDPKEE